MPHLKLQFGMHPAPPRPHIGIIGARRPTLRRNRRPPPAPAGQLNEVAHGLTVSHRTLRVLGVPPGMERIGINRPSPVYQEFRALSSSPDNHGVSFPRGPVLIARPLRRRIAGAVAANGTAVRTSNVELRTLNLRCCEPLRWPPPDCPPQPGDAQRKGSLVRHLRLDLLLSHTHLPRRL